MHHILEVMTHLEPRKPTKKHKMNSHEKEVPIITLTTREVRRKVYCYRALDFNFQVIN